MMLDGNRLVVISTVSSWNIPRTDALSSAMGWDDGYGSWRTPSLTKFTILDITNRSSPESGKELYLEGYYMTEEKSILQFEP